MSFVLKIGSFFLLFITQIVLARTMSLEGFGFYSYLISISAILHLIASFGQPNLNTRNFSRIPDNSSVYVSLAKTSIKRNIILSSIIIFIAITLIYVFKWNWKEIMAVVIILSITPISSINASLNGILLGRKNIVQSNIGDKLVRPILISLSAWLLYEINGNLSIFEASLITLLSTIVVLLINYAFYSINLKSVKRNEEVLSKNELNNSWKIGLSLMITSGMYVLFKQIDIIMIGTIIETDSAGIYKVASRLSNLAVFSLMAVNIVVAPHFSKLYSENKMKELQKLLTYSSRIIFTITCFISIGLIIFSDKILSLFGETYTSAQDILYILLIGQIVNSATGSVGFLMNMTNLHKQATIILSISTVLNLILNYVLIKLYNIEGAAIATTITTIIINISMAIYCYTKMKLRSSLL